MILNLLDERVWKLTPHYTSYTVSKSALWTLTQTLALALAPRIRVNAIGPGPVLPAQGQSDAEFLRMCQATPLQHGATPEEVAQTATALAAMRAVTGQMVAPMAGSISPGEQSETGFHGGIEKSRRRMTSDQENGFMRRHMSACAH